MNIDISRDYACKLDQADELAGYREQFFNADPGMIYMDGNSLGKLPLRTIERVEQIVKDEWGTKLIRSWGINWFQAPNVVGEKIAKLVGAAEGQVAVSDSTTINLYKLAMSALMLRPERKKIITDTLNFPSDLYMLQGCSHVLGRRVANQHPGCAGRDRRRYRAGYFIACSFQKRIHVRCEDYHRVRPSKRGACSLGFEPRCRRSPRGVG
jgi:kynureninase